MSAAEPTVAVDADEVGVFPLSFAQQRLWFLHRLEPGGALYNMPLRLRLRGELDVDALREAIRRVVERHESLRTQLHEHDGEAYQVILPPGPPPLSLGALDGGERERLAAELALDEANQPFDVEGGPLFRARLVRLGDDDHLLLLTAHHAIADGWSLNILLRELAELYTAEVQGREADLPELPIQYVDYAVWQRELLSGERLESELTYWRELLEGAPPLLELPTDRPRPAVQSDRGAHVRGTVPAELVHQLRTIATEERATLFMALLAAFSSLVGRYARQDDLVVGSPIANRGREELESVIGFFANTLALRIDLSGDPSFRELVRRTREMCLGAYSHQTLPFEKLVEELNPSRRLSHSPLFQVMFALQNHEHAALDLPELEVTSMSLEGGRSKFDLALFTVEQEAGLILTFEYAIDLFDTGTIEQMLDHFGLLLERVVEQPDTPLSMCALLTAAEHRRIVEEWNDTAAAFPRAPLHELVTAAAEGDPDAVALQLGSEELTYGELEAHANRVARELVERGVTPGSLVGICLERSLDLVVAMLGVLKTGAAYVPVDPTYPPERRDFILADAGIVAVLTTDKLRSGIDLVGSVQIVSFDSDAGRIGGHPTEPLSIQVDAEMLAYVIYTSGSTGRPKGVEIRHRSVANLVSHMRGALNVTADDIVANLTTFAFDLSVPDFYLPLTSRARLVLVPRERTQDADALADALDETGVSLVQATPTTWQMLVDRGWQGSTSMKIVCGGEALPRSLANELVGRCAELWHAYGPTETTVWSSLGRLAPGEGPTPIAGPLSNTRFYIVEPSGQPCADGVPGELWIGGIGVARGYRNRPDLTDERFVADRLGPDPHAIVYRTGDLVRRRRDGTIEFLGRMDHQVKLRGYRIELGEIEAVLLAHERVHEAVVVATEGALLAYFVTGAHDSLDPADLREHAARSLPGYMVPASFVRLERLPLTPNGKLDRAALPAPELSRSAGESPAPADELEEALLDLWRSMLGIDAPIGVEDDFFSLGGHSLLAVKLFSRIERIWGVRLPLAVLFETATVRHVARALRAEQGRMSNRSTVIPLRPAGDKSPLFVVHGHDGELLFYRDLVRHLPRDQPVYGIQGVGTDGRQLPHTQFEAMAAHYVEDLVRFHPEGPFLLVGYCFAGVLAYEIARQLLERGREPALLGLIDAFPFGHGPRWTRRELERRKFADLRQRDLRGKLEWVHTRSKGLLYKINTRLRWILFDHLSRSRWPVPRFLWNMVAVTERAKRSYVVPPSACSVTLFRAAEAGRRAAVGNDSLWHSLAQGGVDIRWVEGDGVQHDNIVHEPYAAALAAEVAGAIQSATNGRTADSGSLS